jgi:hypothetical protein
MGQIILAWFFPCTTSWKINTQHDAPSHWRQPDINTQHDAPSHWRQPDINTQHDAPSHWRQPDINTTHSQQTYYKHNKQVSIYGTANVYCTTMPTLPTGHSMQHFTTKNPTDRTTHLPHERHFGMLLGSRPIANTDYPLTTWLCRTFTWKEKFTVAADQHLLTYTQYKQIFTKSEHTFCLYSTRPKALRIFSMLTLSDPMSDRFWHYDFPVPDAFPHVVRTLANR